MIIVTEAGGRVTDLNGGPYHPGGPDVLVTNGHIHDEVLKTAADIATKVAEL